MVHGQSIDNMNDLAIDSRLILNKDIDIALQELDLLFNVTNTELIGYPDFGTNFEQFLWELTPSTDQLCQYVNKKIQTETLFLKDMDFSVDVSIDNQEYGDPIYIVNIDLKDINGNQITRIYKLK